MIYPPPSLSEAVSDAIDEAADLSEWIGAHHPGKISLTRAAHIAGPSFSIVLVHREAVMLLMRYDCRTSAFALLRSVFESMCRGLWAEKYLNTPAGANLFKEHKGSMSMDQIVKALDHGTGKKEHTELKRALWGALSDYAHGGLKQVMRWISDDEIAPKHTDIEVIEVLRWANLFGLVALAGLARLNEMDTTVIEAKRQEYAVMMAGTN